MTSSTELGNKDVIRSSRREESESESESESGIFSSQVFEVFLDGKTNGEIGGCGQSQLGPRPMYDVARVGFPPLRADFPSLSNNDNQLVTVFS